LPKRALGGASPCGSAAFPLPDTLPYFGNAALRTSSYFILKIYFHHQIMIEGVPDIRWISYRTI
ncbi:MAG: hypothetical protein ACE5OP_06310, partial [Candidatus Glassbacteria bacterium]